MVKPDYENPMDIETLKKNIKMRNHEIRRNCNAITNRALPGRGLRVMNLKNLNRKDETRIKELINNNDTE